MEISTKVRNQGIEGIKRGNCFIKQPGFITNEFKEHIKNLKLSDDYCDTNFKHFKELLEKRENIRIFYAALTSQANKFSKDYIKKYNKRFSVKAENTENNFIPVLSYLDY